MRPATAPADVAAVNTRCPYTVTCVGPAYLGAIVAFTTDTDRKPSLYGEWLAPIPALSHLTVDSKREVV